MKSVGCLLKKSLCRAGEYCADDNLLGRCLPVHEQSSHRSEITNDYRTNNFEQNIDDNSLILLKNELLRVSQLGITLTDLFVNCFLNYIHQFGTLPENI